MRFLKWILGLSAKQKGYYRVQIFKECIRIHPKDEDRKIKDIQKQSLEIFARAHQLQEKLKHNNQSTFL
jgi:hypothetical protein